MLIAGPRTAVVKLSNITSNTMFDLPAYHAITGIIAINRSPTGSEYLTFRLNGAGFPLVAGFLVNVGAWKGSPTSSFLMWETDEQIEVFASDWTDMDVDLVVTIIDLTPWA
jgi:hypothetical protein